MIKNKKQTPQALVYGVHPVLELLRAKRRPTYQIYTTDPAPKAFSQIKPLLPAHIPVTIVKKDFLTRMAETADHQGIIAITTPFPVRKKPFDSKHNPFLLLVDSVQDTRNLGAILRSAYCTGVSGVVLSGSHAASINAAVCKSAAGLLEHLEISTYPTALNAAQELKKAGYNLYMGALGGDPVKQVPFMAPLCVVIGNEATGISPQILALGQKIMLPQKKADISYNASVAAGILLFLAAIKNDFI